MLGWDFGHGEPLDLSLIWVILMAESLRIASQITRNVFLATHNPFGQREQVQSIEFRPEMSCLRTVRDPVYAR